MANWLTIELLFGTLLVAAFVSNGLLALWAATSPRHRFLRGGVVLTVLSPLLLIPAYELWAIGALQACVVVAGVRAWQKWKSRRTSDDMAPGETVRAKRRIRIRFTLRTLLAAIAVVAIVFGLITTDGPALTIALNGICSGCAVLLGMWAFASRRKWIVWPMVFVLCLAFAAVMAWFDWLFMSVTFELWRDWPPNHATPLRVYTIGSAPYPALAWFAILPSVTAIIWLMVRLRFAGWRASGIADQITTPPTRSVGRVISRCLFSLLLVAVTLPHAAVAWKLLNRSPMPNLPTSDPNGIHDIVRAGREFHACEILRSTHLRCSTDELAAAIAEYGESYERLRLGLSRDIQVRDWTKEGIALEREKRQEEKWLVFDVPNAARALIYEAELAQRQSRPGEAARIAVECIRLSHAIARNGLIDDYYCAVAIEELGNRMLHQTVPALDIDHCREALAALCVIDQNREYLEDARHRDRVWNENSGDWFRRLLALLDAASSRGDDASLCAKLRRESMMRLLILDFTLDESPCAGFRREAITRLLILDLAIQAYGLEHGSPPERLEQLIPEFLATLPIDPFDPEGGSFRYVRADREPNVYSVGPDGDDDNGGPIIQGKWGWVHPDNDGDFRLDIHRPSKGKEADEDSAEDKGS
jgi:hypothetical protein